MRWITALLAATLFVGCSNDTVDDTDVNPDVIWGKYETRFNAQTNDLWFYSQLRVGGSSGTTVRLTGDAKITVDGDRLRVVDGDENPVNLAGTFYTLNQSVAMPNPTYTFVWTRADGEQFTNVVTQAKAIAVTAPAAGATVSNGEALTIEWGEALGAGEHVNAHLDTKVESNTTFKLESVNSGSSLVIPADDMKDFPAGPAELHLVRYFEEGVSEGHPENGGKRISSYVSQKIDLTITAAE
ncbi:MAG: hypothetical protein H6702_08925 [Myxococcales bacterium]|nr:hypothetical protein [Myxococcales bacterium]